MCHVRPGSLHQRDDVSVRLHRPDGHPGNVQSFPEGRIVEVVVVPFKRNDIYPMGLEQRTLIPEYSILTAGR